MRKLVLATILAGTALFGGMTANAAEIHADTAFPDSHEIALPQDVSFGLFGHSHRYDPPPPPPPPPGDRHYPPPPPPEDRGPRIDGRYGPRHPSPTSGAKYGPREYNG